MRKTVTELAMPEQGQRLIRLAPYTRVSSGSDDQLHSFAAQVKYYTEYAAAHPEYELVDIYADEAVTGTRMDKRDDLNRLLRDCRKGKIDRIITKSVSRFARNTTELLTMVRGLKELGVSIYFEEQGIDTAAIDLEMILTFPGMAAQKESETISENMRWSYQKRMESGDFNCCKAAYGYELIDGQLYINEAEAVVIRRIFDLYLQGCGKQAIANQLNTDGIPRRYGYKTWHLNAIHYILNNERYMGDALLQKNYTTETLPFRKRRNRGEKPQYYVENSNPAIVSREVFQAAQALGIVLFFAAVLHAEAVLQHIGEGEGRVFLSGIKSLLKREGGGVLPLPPEVHPELVFDAPAGISGEARPAGGVEGVHGFHQANGAQRTAVSGAFAA